MEISDWIIIGLACIWCVYVITTDVIKGMKRKIG
jgi:uncharacterized membrane protein YuzA (DUF378 family)